MNIQSQTLGNGTQRRPTLANTSKVLVVIHEIHVNLLALQSLRVSMLTHKQKQSAREIRARVASQQ